MNGHAQTELPNTVVMQLLLHSSPPRGIRPEFSGQQRLGNDQGLCAHEKDTARRSERQTSCSAGGTGSGFSKSSRVVPIGGVGGENGGRGGTG